MSAFRQLEALRARVRADVERWPGRWTMQAHAAMLDSLPFVLDDDGERMAAIALESVYRDRIAATLTERTPAELDALAAASVDGGGRFRGRSGRAVSDAVAYERDRRGL